VLSLREAQRRFNSLNSHVIRHRYERAICVWERQKSGRIHFHLLVVVETDIRTGANFVEFDNQVYKSANVALRSEWAFWRKTAPLYRFGRTELLPVKSTIEGIGKYVGKYVAKHITFRSKEDIGARVVRFLGYQSGDRKFKAQFAWAGGKSREWRQKLAVFAKLIHVQDMDGMRTKFGARWAYVLQNVIVATQLHQQQEVRLTYERKSNRLHNLG